MTYDDFATGLRSVIRQLLALPANSVRPANQDAPQTGDVWASLLLTPVASAGTPADFNTNIPDQPDDVFDVNEVVVNQREFSCSLQIFNAPDSFEMCSRLCELLWSDKAADLLRTVFASVASLGTPRDISAVNNALWQRRGQLTFSIYALQAVTIATPTYGTFPMTVQIDTETDPIPFKVTEPS